MGLNSKIYLQHSVYLYLELNGSTINSLMILPYYTLEDALPTIFNKAIGNLSALGRKGESNSVPERERKKIRKA